MTPVDDLVTLVQRELSERADADKAISMQRYMKTDMPFYGVQKPGRKKVMRAVRTSFAPKDREEYIAACTALWALPRREEKYLAQAVATTYRTYVVPGSISLFRRFIVEGAWWDFVDETATHMIRPLVVDHPHEVWPFVDRWIDDPDMWLRRTAIICQVGAKESTDADRLFDFCRRRAHESEFFIRKAIGWALREYSKTDADTVRSFTTDHRDVLSGLSYREATKYV
ncbi:MAG: DNA alkylation repair protein [Acidimicrobiia bacterium]|nr:DNA alkylation repair protein [Acidimicrobiia bacterium]